MKFAIVAVAVVAMAPALGASATDEPAAPLNLSCNGHGAFMAPNLDEDERGQFKSDTRSETQGRVRLRIDGNRIQIRLPATMPGGDAWKTADDVSVTPDRFSGKVRLGLMTTVRFVVDRHTGDIDVTGPIQFGGACEKAPAEDAPAKF